MSADASPVPMVGLIDYHSGDVTERCIESVLSTSSVPLQFVIVDNGGAVRIDRPDVTVIEPGRNLGFAGGCNVLLDRARAAGAPWLWILNNDCTLEHGWLPHVEAAVASGFADIYTSVSLHGDTDRVWYGGGRIEAATNRHSHEFYGELATTLDLPALSRTQWASGANLIVPRATFVDCAPFDEHLFLYREETDWQRTNGFTVGLIGTPLVRHYAGATTRSLGPSLETFFSARNSWITGNRYLTRARRVRFWTAWLTDFVAKPLLRGRFGQLRAGWSGRAARNLSGPEALGIFQRISDPTGGRPKG